MRKPKLTPLALINHPTDVFVELINTATNTRIALFAKHLHTMESIQKFCAAQKYQLGA